MTDIALYINTLPKSPLRTQHEPIILIHHIIKGYVFTDNIAVGRMWCQSERGDWNMYIVRTMVTCVVIKQSDK